MENTYTALNFVSDLVGAYSEFEREICIDFDEEFINMAEFDDFFYDKSPIELVKDLDSDFCVYHDYFRYEIYGIKSYADYEAEEIIMENVGNDDEFLEFIFDQDLVEFCYMDDTELKEVMEECRAAGLESWADYIREEYLD